MIKVASLQMTPKNTFEKRKQQIYHALVKAKNENIDFLCLPEGSLTGYYTEEVLAKQNSLCIQDNEFSNWLDSISSFTTTLIIGFNERQGEMLFDSAAIIEKGKILGIQRKHYLYHTYFNSGKVFTPFHTKGICFGVVICLDTNYFEPSKILSLQGASIIFSPMCNKVSPSHPYANRPPYYSHLAARSHENRSWIVTADWIFQDDNFVCPGHSVIYNPNGQEIKRSTSQKEELLVVDITHHELLAEKGLRVLGSPIMRSLLMDQLTKITYRENS